MAKRAAVADDITKQVSVEDARRIVQLGKERPDLWAEEIFGVSLWPIQAEILKAIFQKQRVVVRSCSGSGKSFSAAVAVLTFLYNFRPSTVLTTAPTFRQVESILWKEIASLHGKARVFLDGTLTATSLQVGSKWFALGLSTDEPERFQGFHNINVLVVGDEASGLPPGVYQAIENPLSTGNAHLLLIGNPTQPAGEFKEAFESDIYEKFHISAFDTPNFEGITIDDIKSGAWKEKETPRPYLVTPRWVSERYEEWGENSYQWQVYVLGDFPESGVDSVFRLSDIERSMKRTVDFNNQPDFTKKIGDSKVCALDVSRYGEDETVFTSRIGRRVMDFVAWSHQDTIYTEGRTVRQLKVEQPQVMVIDSVALGAGVFDAINREMDNMKVVEFNAGHSAIDKERYGNRRSELYFKLARMIEKDELDLPNDNKLKKQLLDCRYYYNRKGQIFIESKEEARARGAKSPDRVDVVVMTLDTMVKMGGKPNVKYYLGRS